MHFFIQKGLDHLGLLLMTSYPLTISWHTKLAPAVIAAMKTEFSYVIIPHRNIGDSGYIEIWIT